ncbi:MAG TPA: hypothetical protein VIS07_16625 [Candidatus Binatia bacterium]
MTSAPDRADRAQARSADERAEKDARAGTDPASAQDMSRTQIALPIVAVAALVALVLFAAAVGA